ncbi:MAG: class I SAM-dependent methyltransferase [Bacteroidales bacterium]
MDLKEYKINAAKQRHPWELARINVVRHLLQKCVSKTSQYIYDIGCGDAFVLNALQEKMPHHKYIAIDNAFDDTLLRQFKEKYSNIEFLRNLSDSKTKGDIILLLDVLEHIEQPKEFLEHLKQSKLMNDKASIIITVPAFQSLYSAHDVWLGHYKRYSQSELIASLEQLGFKIVSSGYFFTSLLILVFIKKKLEHILPQKQQSGIGTWRGGVFLSTVLSVILRIDYLLFSKLLRCKGLSVYAICQLK